MADPVETALEAESSAEMRASLGHPRPLLRLPQIARLTSRLRRMPEERKPLRIALLRTYSTELLAPHLAFESLLAGFDADVYQGPYGVVMQESDAGSGLVAHDPDVTFVFLRPDDLGPGFSGRVSLLEAAQRTALVESGADHAVAMLSAVRGAVRGTIVVTLLPPMAGRELGNLDVMVDESEALVRFELKRAIAARLRDSLADVLLHDLDETMASVGRERFFDARLWHSSRFPFSTAGSQRVVRDLMGYAVRIASPPAKVIVLDADNTLWGGIVGEDGPEGVALGPDYPGSCFVEFQERILDFRQRGILLAMCSKNNEADVLELLESHPHQVLREDDFAALRINWEPKPANLQSLAEELNLGVDSFVFVDDSPHECHSVAMSLPGVTVVQTPADPLAIPTCLDHEPRLEILSLTREDRRRAEMYGEEVQRRKLATGASSVEDYLASLEMVMTVTVNDRPHLARVAQLTQKTNQFNLTTRRHSEAEVEAFMAGPDSFVHSFSLEDRFGDSGIVGVAIVGKHEQGVAEIETFLMSCRVIGRRAETAFLEAVLDECVERGFSRVRAEYIPTAKNGQVEAFWPDHGFRELEPGVFEVSLDDLRAFEPAPPITVHVREPAPSTNR